MPFRYVNNQLDRLVLIIGKPPDEVSRTPMEPSRRLASASGTCICQARETINHLLCDFVNVDQPLVFFRCRKSVIIVIVTSLILMCCYANCWLAAWHSGIVQRMNEVILLRFGSG